MLKRIALGILFWLLASAEVTNAQTVTAPSGGAVPVRAANDYATRAFQDPWDMNERTDVGRFINGVDVSSGLGSITFSGGVMSATTTNGDPLLYLLETGNPNAVAHGKIGTNYPIAADTYKILAFRMSSSVADAVQLFWAPQTDYDSNRSWAFNIATSTGYRIYLQDLRDFTQAAGRLMCVTPQGSTSCTPQEWGGTVRSLRLDPVSIAGAGVSLAFDWFRIVEVNPALCQRIEWTGAAGAIDIYLDNDNDASNGTLGPIARSASNNQASAGCTAAGTGFNFYAGALPGGTYYVAIATAGATPNSTNLKYSTGYYQVNELPTLTFTSPSEEGSSDDFATTQLGDAWDMNALSDIDLTRFLETSPPPAIATITGAVNEAGAAVPAFGAFRATSVDKSVSGGVVGDPYIYPLWHLTRGTTVRIDPDRYRILTVDMGLPNKAQHISQGSVARIVWKVDGDPNGANAENVSDDIILNSRADATVVATLNLDMKTLAIEAGAGSPSHQGWNAVAGSSFPGIDSFRLDPHEFGSPTEFFVKRIKLAALDSATTSYTIGWTSNKSSGTVTFYYDNNTDSTTTLGLVGSATVTATTGSLVWNTSAVPNGTYYIYGVFDDGTNTNGTYAKWPIIVSSTCSYSLSPASQTMTAAGGTGNIRVTAAIGCAWTASSDQSWLTVTSGASGNGSGTVNFSVSAQTSGVTRTATVTIAGQTFTLTQTGNCSYTVSPTEASYRATGGSGTITVTTSAGCAWTAVSNNAFITITSGSSGSGSGTVGYSTPDTSNTDNRSGTMTVAGRTVTIHQAGSSSTPPFGLIETPVDGTTGVTGAIPVTGWALDDIGISKVRVYRGGSYVGDATMVAGARPDVAAAYPTYPFKDQAGWGYMLLTNMLPGQGNGAYQLNVYAEDVEGRSTFLGSRTITCSNATATKPFGAIDTPGQGTTVSGAAYVNFGWALTPPPKSIPTNGSTINVFVDGALLGTATYNNYRSDIATLFPGYANTNGAIGYRVFDTTALADGVHTIVWSVTDDQGAAEGIGSRFFTVQNGASLVAAPAGDARVAPAAVMRGDPAGEEPSRAAWVSVWAQVGFDLTAPLVRLEPDEDGRRMVTLPELGRLELRLSDGPGWAGFMRVGTERTPLPIGSRLDPATGEFTWTPGVGFIGAYELEFVRGAGTADEVRVPVTVMIRPKHEGPSRVHLVIDAPRGGTKVTQPLLVGGWALDEVAFAGTGVDAIHVWAYPNPGSGADPLFVGVATLDGRRPDVARAFGAQFGRAGFGLFVNGLAPGTYDLAVFPHSTVTGEFAAARVVRVIVR